MGQFTLSWDNTPIINNPNVLVQRASYRRKDLGGAYITTGFNPSNDLPKSAFTTDSSILDDNVVYQFKVDSICTVNGPTINQNGVLEDIQFACLVPAVTFADTTSQIVLNVINTNITKARFTLRKTSDSSIIMADTIITRSGNSITCTKTGLVADTLYYWQYDLYSTVGSSEMISSTAGYLGTKCGPYSFKTEVAATICPTIDSVTPSSIVSSSGSNGQVTITFATTPSSGGTFKLVLDGGSPTAITTNPFTITGLTAGVHTIAVSSLNSSSASCSTLSTDVTIPATTCEAVCPTNVGTVTPAVTVAPTGYGGTINVSWTKDNCADQYKVLITRHSDSAFVQSIGPSAIGSFNYDSGTNKYSYPFNNLIPGVELDVKVTAFKAGTETTGCTNIQVTPAVPTDAIYVYARLQNDATIPSEATILAFGVSGSLTAGYKQAIVHNTDPTFNFTAAGGNKYVLIAEPITETAKTKWDWDGAGVINQGNIAGTTGSSSNLFGSPTTLTTLRVYISEYATGNADDVLQLKKV